MRASRALLAAVVGWLLVSCASISQNPDLLLATQIEVALKALENASSIHEERDLRHKISSDIDKLTTSEESSEASEKVVLALIEFLETGDDSYFAGVQLAKFKSAAGNAVPSIQRFIEIESKRLNQRPVAILRCKEHLEGLCYALKNIDPETFTANQICQNVGFDFKCIMLENVD